MKDYALSHGGQYHAPYWYGSTNQYEPDGSEITDGSNVPDYATFCSDCHNNTNTIYSSTLGRNLKYINWSNQNKIYPQNGDFHGAIPRCFDVDGNISGTWRICGCFKENFFATHPHFPDWEKDDCPEGWYRDPVCASNLTDKLKEDCKTNGSDGYPDNKECGSCCCINDSYPHGVDYPVWWGDIKPPYSTANYSNFILNCTDCHEPHGAIHGEGTTIPYLLRKTVNGHYNKQCAGGPGNPCSWEEEFCRSCHHHRENTFSTYVPEFNVWIKANGAHCGNYGSCLNCHYHNAYEKCFACWWCAVPPVGGTPGHTF